MQSNRSICANQPLMRGRWLASFVKHKRYPHAFLLLEGLDSREKPIRKRIGLIYRASSPIKSHPLQPKVDYFDITDEQIKALYKDKDNYLFKSVLLTPGQKNSLNDRIEADQNEKQKPSEFKTSLKAARDNEYDTKTWLEKTILRAVPEFDLRSGFKNLDMDPMLSNPLDELLQLKTLFYLWSGWIDCAYMPGVFDFITLFIPFFITRLTYELVELSLPDKNKDVPESFGLSHFIKLIFLSPLVILSLALLVIRLACSIVGAILTLPLMVIMRCFLSAHENPGFAKNQKAFSLSVLNSFRNIFETNKYTHARTLRTNFLQKISDTFFVFSGSTLSSKKEYRGLFDYLTFMVPYGITHLALWLNSFKHPVTTIIAIPFMAASLGIDALRYTLAAAFTILVSPIVGIVQFCSNKIGGLLKKNTLSLPVQTYDGHEFKGTLRDLLDNGPSSLQDVRVHASGTYNNLTLEFKKKTQPVTPYKDCMYPRKPVVATTSLNLDAKDDRNVFDALLQLNVGNLAKRLEKINVPVAFFHKARTITDDDKAIVINTKREKPKRQSA